MTKVCVGGAYDGLVINGLEDQLACTGNEGHIEDRGGGGCASASIARGPDFTSRENLGVIASLVLFPLRLVRSRLTQSPTIKLLEKVNDELLSEIDDVANHDPSLRKELHEVVLKASYYASAMLQSKTDGKNNIDPVFTSGLHSQITATADRLKKAMRDEHKKQSLDNAVGMLKVLVGKKASEASALLLGNSQSHSPQFATSTSKIRLTQIPVRTSPFTVTEITVWSKIARLIMELDKATRAIAAKAAQLGSIAGSSVGDVTAVTGGYVQQFQNCDIYYSPDTGAHEVHGDIRAKYNALHGPDGVLRLPTTDETGTPDGFGRFNHFVGGSIYWTPDTGPMMVRGAIRDVWSGLGWERSWLGYPVADEYRMVTFSPATDPKTFWSHFQNGSILSSSDGAAVALTADLTPDVLKGVLHTKKSLKPRARV